MVPLTKISMAATIIAERIMNEAHDMRTRGCTCMYVPGRTSFRSCVIIT